MVPSEDSVTHFHFSYRIMNNSSCSILVQNHGGMNCIIPACKDGGYNLAVSLRVDLTFKNADNIIFDIEGCQNPLDKAIMVGLAEKIKEFKNNCIHEYYIKGYTTVSTYIVLGNEHASGLERELVSHLLSITLTKKVEKKKTEFKGATTKAVSQEMFDKLDKVTDGDSIVLVGMRINDCHNRLGPLWTSLTGVGVNIPKHSDPTKPEGLYIVNSYLTGNDPEIFVPIEELTEDKIKSLGIYNSKREADAGGNSKLLQNLQSKVENLSKDLDKMQTESADLMKRYLTQAEIFEDFKRASKMEIDRSKFREEVGKAKQNSGVFAELIKGVTALAGCFFTGYKLFAG